MDNLAKHDRSVTVDFAGNPFECSCRLNPFIKWMKKTRVFLRNKANLQCYEGIEYYVFFFIYEDRNLHSSAIIRKCKSRLSRNEELRTEIASFRSTRNNGATLLPLDDTHRPGMRSGLSATDETPEKDRAGARFSQQESAIYFDSER